MKSTDVVDLFYHMDASFKDDICTICQGAGALMFCSKCPRGFHKSCLHLNAMKEVGDYFYVEFVVYMPILPCEQRTAHVC